LSGPWKRHLAMSDSFYRSKFDQPHPTRTRAIIKAHPEVRELMVRNPGTVAIPIVILVLQTSIAYAMGGSVFITGGLAF